MAIAGIGALVVPAIRYLRTSQVDRQRETWQVVTPPTSSTSSFAISPDGLRLVFSATVAGKVELWIRPLSALTAQPLLGTEGGILPFWRPTARPSVSLRRQVEWIHAAGGRRRHRVGAKRLGQVVEQNGDILFCLIFSTAVAGLVSPGSVPVGHAIAVVAVGPYLSLVLPDGRHFYRAIGNAEGRSVVTPIRPKAGV
jgi:hypothetical protein